MSDVFLRILGYDVQYSLFCIHTTVTPSLLIFFGSGLGGALRYWIAQGTYTLLGRSFPYGTLVVNATGCFCMGLLFSLLLERFNGLGETLRPFLLIGILGGYTTFSTFSIETLQLYESGHWCLAILNIVASVGLCIALTGLGVYWGRQ